MKKLKKAVKKIDLNTVDLANAICDIIVNNYGEHNYKDFKDVVNSRLWRYEWGYSLSPRSPQIFSLWVVHT